MHDAGRQVGLAGRNVGLLGGVDDEDALGVLGEGVPGRKVGGHDDRGIGPGPLNAAEVDIAQFLGEDLQLLQRWLGAAPVVRDPEVQLEGVVGVGPLVLDIVVVRVVPRDPPRCAGGQCRVQQLPVIGGTGLRRGEIAGEPELLHNDRPLRDGGEFADEGRLEVLADPVVLHPVHVRPHEVDERPVFERAESGVVPGRLDAPLPVPQAHRLGSSPGPDGVDHEQRPGIDDPLVPLPAVDRDLIGDEPSDDRRVGVEAARELGDVPRLAPDHPHVRVDIAPLAPGRVPVLPRHVPDDECGDRAHPEFVVRVEEIRVPPARRLVEPVRLGHEIRPVEERARHRQAVLAQDPQLLPDDIAVVPGPHSRAALSRPEIRSDPGPSPAFSGERPHGSWLHVSILSSYSLSHPDSNRRISLDSRPGAGPGATSPRPPSARPRNCAGAGGRR